ncbi:8-oxoguanine glycosylase ogg1 [Madurella fahalii]|uniref:DNA-(apurinic or apyrimidinic site) lyase n=1 Tax=Madurella fahalii TaxID=1157608 RepID=A0ABQ0G113_9PEZI
MGAPKVQNVSEWRKLPLSLTELCIDTTLRCGQSFRWRKINDEWHCVLRGRIVSLRQDPLHLHYRVTWPKAAAALPTPPASLSSASPSPVGNDTDAGHDDTASLLHSYFALSHSLSSLYKQWAASDANFARRAPAFTGIRILNQDAWEALVAFICSSNNNISRISQMVHKLCVHYGPYIGSVDGQPFHDFPEPDALAGTHVEAHLRELGFGYRARYIAQTAEVVARRHRPGWLLGLRNPACPAFGTPQPGQETGHGEADAEPTSYRAAQEALLTLPGVGPKVADCVCLMGLGWGEAVPIDTHVWQIAQRDYNFRNAGKTKSLTKGMYDAVGDHFRKIWGPQAGWAQSVLFTANLKSFAEQASAKKFEADVEVARVEKAVTVQQQVSPGGRETTVKVEESQETITTKTISQTKKRRATMVERSIKPEGASVKVAEVETQLRRSKRRKAVVN